MGNGAHICKKRIINYTQGAFWGEARPLEEYLKENLRFCDFTFFRSDDSPSLEEWEISRNALVKLVNGLKKNYHPEEPIFGEHTAKDLIEIFEEWLNTTSNFEDFSDPEWVYISWF